MRKRFMRPLVLHCFAAAVDDGLINGWVRVSVHDKGNTSANEK